MESNPISWASVSLAVDHAGGSRFKREYLKKKFRKLWQTGFMWQTITPLWRYRLCLARLYLRDFSDYSGWEFRDEAGWSSDLYFKDFAIPGWDGKPVKRLIVMGEQGLGDQIMWASILETCKARCKEVVYECDERLHSLLERSLGVECRPVRESGISDDGDAFIPAAELMRMFRRTWNDFPRKPFLVPDPERVREFDGFKEQTGISWKGRQGSIPPERFPQGVCLQYDATDERFLDPGIDLKNDIEGVVALCSVLSHVICVPTSILHLAGAVGTKVSVIEPEIEGEIFNQLRWECSPGESAFYRDVTTYSNGEWNAGSQIREKN